MADSTTAPSGEMPDGGQNPVPTPTPQPTQSAPSQEPDEDEAYDKERALATIRKLRQEAKQAVAAIRERDSLKAEQQARTDAQLSEHERLNKRAAQLEAELASERGEKQNRINRYEVQLRAAQLGIVDPDAAVKLLDWAALEYGADGTPKDIDKALKLLLRERPFLAAQAPAPSMAATNGATRAQAPGGRIYSKQELNDYAFYSAHRDDIVRAMKEGRVVD